eukprot:CCRYP_005278-RD/>CCRYP_005278-RD protein AED:0.47 eAED:0.50 QI:77/0/0/1/0/0/3/0/80
MALPSRFARPFTALKSTPRATRSVQISTHVSPLHHSAKVISIVHRMQLKISAKRKHESNLPSKLCNACFTSTRWSNSLSD